MLRPSQVLTLDEITLLGEIFARILGGKPRIVHFGSHLILYRTGNKLILYFTLSTSGAYELEIKYFGVPANLRSRGLGSSFFRELMKQEYIRERFAVIRLLPVSEKARRFWEKVGFTITSNGLFLHYQKSECEKVEK